MKEKWHKIFYAKILVNILSHLNSDGLICHNLMNDHRLLAGGLF